jgi:4'-phosphopantetheinyl transferase
VWRADLRATSDSLADLLSAAERARAERILGERAKLRWTRARGTLRALLGRYLGSDPRALRLTVTANGKPTLIDHADATAGSERSPGTHTALSFNVSHSGWLALYAFTRTGEVGVDIEVVRKPIDAVALALRALGPAEARRLARLDSAIRQKEFLRAWTQYEAKLKHLGVGIGGRAASAREPLVLHLGIGQRAAAALAIGRATRELRCWEYRLAQPATGVLDGLQESALAAPLLLSG